MYDIGTDDADADDVHGTHAMEGSALKVVAWMLSFCISRMYVQYKQS